MIPILGTISNNVVALPAAATTAQPVMSQRGQSGFALALAGAQGLTTSPVASGAVQSAGGVVGSAATATANLNVRTPQNLPGKKILSNDPLAALISVVPASIAAGLVPVPILIPLPGPQPSLLPPSLLQSGFAPSQTVAAAPVQTADVIAGTVQPGLQTKAHSAAPQSATSGYPTLNQTTEIFPPVTSAEGTADSQINPATPGGLVPMQTYGQVSGQEASIANVTQAATIPPIQPESNAGVASKIAGSQWNVFQDQSAPAKPVLLAESTPISAVSSAPTGQPVPGSFSLNISPDSGGSGLPESGLESRPAESIAQAYPLVEVTVPSPTLLASTTAKAGVDPGPPLSSAANLQSVQANSANATPDAATQIAQSAVAGEAASASGANAQISASAVADSPGQPAPDNVAQRFAKVTAAVASRGVGNADGPTSIPASTSSTGSDADNGLQQASPTPFSVFFSGPAPGAGSAASTLPKMILPATSSGIQNSHTAGIGAPSANPQSSGGSAASQNAAPPSAKDSPAASASGSPPASPPLRRDADLSRANVAAPSSQIAAAPAPAPAPPAVVPLGGQPALVADSAPKASTLPGDNSSSPASVVPAAPQAPVVAVEGAVQVAQMVNRVGQSEMRIGMNTSAFGSVEVRTVVHANEVGLVIGSEKGDLRTLLANEMPAITSTLQQQNLRLNSVNFMQGFAFSNNGSGGGDSQQRSFAPMSSSRNSGISEATVDDSVEALPVEFGGGSGRSLSILA